MKQKRNYLTVYMITLRIAAGVGAVMLWYVSIQFSIAGFRLRLPEYTWVGVVLSAVITTIQLVFNRGVNDNPTLFAAGVLAYLYGIITNFFGIAKAQQVIADILSAPAQHAADALFALIVALFIEIVPEALLLWAVFADNENIGDFVSTLLRGVSVQRPPAHNVRTDGRTDTNGHHGRTPEQQAHLFIARYIRQHGSLPSARQVASAVNGVGKTKAAEILKGYRQ